MRMHKLKWYYKNRIEFNLARSRPKGMEYDLGDAYTEEHWA